MSRLAAIFGSSGTTVGVTGAVTGVAAIGAAVVTAVAIREPAPASDPTILERTDVIRALQEPAPMPVLSVEDITLDVVRVTPTGDAIVAGRAEPGADVRMLIDEDIVHETQADFGGNFVAMFSIETQESPSLLTSAQRITGGEWEEGTDQVVIAPRQVLAPDVVATEQQVASAELSAASGATPVSMSTISTPEITAPNAVNEAPRLVRLSPLTGVQIENESTGELRIDTISYTETGTVLLAGQTQGAGTLRIFLNNTGIAETESSIDGRWQTELDDIAPGRYTLRVDEVDEAGKVIARAETPFQRTAPELVRLTQEAAPEAQVSVITVQPGFTLWAIAQDHLGEGRLYVQVFEENKQQIRDPDLIYPGQIFNLPEASAQPSE